MSITHDDYRWMSRALQLAERGRYTTKPNPCVGCVIVGDDGALLGEGWHQQAGHAHAEVNAIVAAGDSAHGATAYVTLEPCSHQGRTGPCTQALLDAGIRRVVCAMQDPNPLVSGQGLQGLAQAGVQVDGPIPEWEIAARELNIGFVTRMERQRPWVRAKIATSLDGRTAMANGESQWITGEAARRDVQKWRARSSAIVTGIESILRDNSRLTLREDELGFTDSAYVQTYAQTVVSFVPMRVVLDTQLRIPMDAAILAPAAPTMIMCAEPALDAQREKVAAMKGLGEHIHIETLPLSDGQLSLRHLLVRLTELECNELMVEAGATLLGSFLQQELLNELVIYQAPIFLGSDAKPMLHLPLTSMAEKKHLTVIDQRKIGQDQRIIARLK